jgi:hypothetical protein
MHVFGFVRSMLCNTVQNKSLSTWSRAHALMRTMHDLTLCLISASAHYVFFNCMILPDNSTHQHSLGLRCRLSLQQCRCMCDLRGCWEPMACLRMWHSPWGRWAYMDSPSTR